MNKIKNKKYKINLTVICVVGYILSVLFIPFLHKHELNLSNQTESCSNHFCHVHIPASKKYDNGVPVAMHRSKHREHHDHAKCPICFFKKYLSSIKYFTLFPTGQEQIEVNSSIFADAKNFQSNSVQLYFNSRAPPA